MVDPLDAEALRHRLDEERARLPALEEKAAAARKRMLAAAGESRRLDRELREGEERVRELTALLHEAERATEA